MKEVKMNVKVFIIPNKVGTINNNLVESAKDRNIKLFNEIFRLNGIDRTIDPLNDALVQLWWHNDKSDNIVCHGCKVEVDGEEVYISPRIEILPACLFEGISEGDTMTLKIPDEDIILNMTITADQLNYRYGNHGSFEEVLWKVTGIPPRDITPEVIKFRADGFIVPNHADTFDECDYWKEQRPDFLAYLNKVCELNGYSGIDFSRDHIVDVWMSSKEDLQSENLGDHGGTITMKDGQQVMVAMYNIHWVPDKILYGRREGDTITIKVPFNSRDFHHPENNDMVFEISLRLAQKEYRYKKFGNFEEVLDKVCGR